MYPVEGAPGHRTSPGLVSLSQGQLVAPRLWRQLLRASLPPGPGHARAASLLSEVISEALPFSLSLCFSFSLPSFLLSPFLSSFLSSFLPLPSILLF